MPFSTLFQLYHSNQCTYQYFPGVLLNSTLHNILFKTLPASHIIIVETMNISERRINPVAMSIINPWKECRLSRRFEPTTENT